MRQYVIIIGAMKSGTTTLFDALARHPSIAPSSNKEPGFFAFDDVYARGFDWFDSLFEFDPDTHRYRLEASTDYTKAPFVKGVWERMTATPNVDVKLIYIMRHPLRRLESHAKHAELHRREIGREISTRTSHSLDAGISSVSLAVSAYAQQLEQYSEAWRSGRLHCLTLEGLECNPAKELSDIWTFLGVEHLRGEAARIEAKNVTAKNPFIHPLWSKLTSITPLLLLGKMMLPSSIRDKLRERFRQGSPRFIGRFTLTSEESTLLSRLYEGDITTLNGSYGIDTERFWELGPTFPARKERRSLSI